MVGNYQPSSLKDALDILAKESVIPYAGGTDLMVEHNEDAKYMFLNRIPELGEIIKEEGKLRIGAGCTYTEVFKSSAIPKLFKDAIIEVAAPAIRNMGTVGGNICNGSPKADFGLVLFVADTTLRLASAKGERIVPISEFYIDRGKTVLKEDELMVEIIVNDLNLENYYYMKVGERNALAISRIAFAAVCDIEDNKIVKLKTAFGAIDRTIFQKNDIDAMLIGKTIKEVKELKADYLKAYDKAINPIRGRVSAEYRKDVCMNLLNDFLESNGI